MLVRVIFLGCAVLLLLAVGFGVFTLNQAQQAPATVEPVRTGRPAVPMVPISTQLPTAAQLETAVASAQEAADKYALAKGAPLLADMAQVDGGLKFYLEEPYLTQSISVGDAIYWRLMTNEKGLVLCAQFMLPSERETLANLLIQAAEAQNFAIALRVCGADALGVQLRPGGTPPAEHSAPVLPALPPGLNPPPVGEPGPQVQAGTIVLACEPNAAVEERLSRLL